MADGLKRKRTSTSNFGVGKRENHDASGFYERFAMPDFSDDQALATDRVVDQIFHGSATDMHQVPDASVALVVTSPPYFAGKAYEEALGEGHIPATYVEYLTMLEEVFAECVRTLEPGGRIAVNVANLGRKPYRSLSADVIRILQDRLRLLMRAEIVWVKQRGASGSCAWGSFQRPSNPVLRDLSERIIVASKGRLDRAVPQRQRHQRGLPSEGSLFRDEFMEATTDIWDIAPERATRVGHPAPYPVELPERLINLYTYRGDVVLDPFMGSGTTAVAAVATERHYLGYDTEPAYIHTANQRIAAEHARIAAEGPGPLRAEVITPAARGELDPDEPFEVSGVRDGLAAKELAKAALVDAGFTAIVENATLPGGTELRFVATGPDGSTWHFDVAGGFTLSRPGLRRAETMYKAIAKAAVLQQTHEDIPFVLFTTDLPPEGSPGRAALDAVVGPRRPICDLIVLTSREDIERLRASARTT
jgi:site-specific DNA-methyltransferase (adenine-specific)